MKAPNENLHLDYHELDRSHKEPLLDFAYADILDLTFDHQQSLKYWEKHFELFQIVDISDKDLK